MFLMYQFENVMNFIFHSVIVEGINTDKDIFPFGITTIPLLRYYVLF